MKSGAGSNFEANSVTTPTASEANYFILYFEVKMNRHEIVGLGGCGSSHWIRFEVVAGPIIHEVQGSYGGGPTEIVCAEINWQKKCQKATLFYNQVEKIFQRKNENFFGQAEKEWNLISWPWKQIINFFIGNRQHKKEPNLA